MFNPNRLNRRECPDGLGKGGFTIAEMIIVMVIMATLATIGSRTYFVERDRFEFNNALTKSMQLIKSVRTYSTTSHPVYVGGKNIIPKGGYGIHVQLSTSPGKSTMTIFANLGDAPNYQEDDGDNAFEPLKDQVLETYTLPKQISFRHFYFKEFGKNEDKKWLVNQSDPKKTGPTALESTFIFKPPMGDMAIVDDFDKPLEQVSLQFKNPASDSTGPKKCQRIIINQIKAFPELLYESVCS